MAIIDENRDPSVRYRVVRNDEEQYSIWHADRDLPPGWYEGGMVGDHDACIAHIETVWTDMRPRSLRERLAQVDSARPAVA